MNIHKKALVAGLFYLLLVLQAPQGRADGTSFSYQGRLNEGGGLASGVYDFTLTLYSTNSGGTAIAGPVGRDLVTVSNGTFVLNADFGANVFDGADRWLEVAVRTNGAGGFTTLTPRQQVLPVPSAIYASKAQTAVSAGSATTAASATSAGIFSGSLAGDVTGTQGATVVAQVGGQSAANIATAAVAANAATSANTAISIVKRDVAGNFSAGAITATSVNGNGAGLVSLNASELASGTVNDLRLSGNVAVRNGNNAFTGSNNVSGVFVATNDSNVLHGTFTGPLTGAVVGNVTGNVSGSSASFIGNLVGDVTGTQSATAVASVGGQSAANVASGVAAANGAASVNTANALIKRDGSGNFSAGTVTASGFVGALTGNVTGNVSGSAASFTGNLVGDVTGSQGATVVANVGGQSAANVASGATAANGAASANTTGAIVKRDGSGNFSAGTVTASGFVGPLNGNVTGNVSGSAASFTGNLTGDVTGTQSATVVSSVGGQSAANIAGGTAAANGATSANTTGAIVKRDSSGNFSAGVVSGAGFVGPLTGDVTGNVSGSATSFTGNLLGDVTGTQSSTVVSSVGGQAASSVASGTAAANGATSANTAGTLVKRDDAGSFSAGTMTGSFVGNGAGLTNLAIAGNYFFCYDINTQMVSAQSVFQDVTFSSNAQINGWTHTAGTASFTCGQSGLYLVQFTGEAGVNISTTTTVTLRLVINGTEAPGSQSAASVTSSSGNVVEQCSRTCLLSLSAGDVVKVQQSCPSLNAGLFPGGGNTAGTTKITAAITAIRLL